MTDVVNQVAKNFRMGETEQKIRYGIGSAAAAAAIFAPLSYKWKGILTAIAAEVILSAVYGTSPVKRMMNA
jgi:Inner membrane protein YgaP-like, transmembrane domain